jgi:hypothetical protein
VLVKRVVVGGYIIIERQDDHLLAIRRYVREPVVEFVIRNLLLIAAVGLSSAKPAWCHFGMS